jgi:hypothetical protein
MPVTVRLPGANTQPVRIVVKREKLGEVKQPLASPTIASQATLDLRHLVAYVTSTPPICR